MSVETYKWGSWCLSFRVGADSWAPASGVPWAPIPAQCLTAASWEPTRWHLLSAVMRGRICNQLIFIECFSCISPVSLFGPYSFDPQRTVNYILYLHCIHLKTETQRWNHLLTVMQSVSDPAWPPGSKAALTLAWQGLSVQIQGRELWDARLVRHGGQRVSYTDFLSICRPPIFQISRGQMWTMEVSPGNRKKIRPTWEIMEIPGQKSYLWGKRQREDGSRRVCRRIFQFLTPLDYPQMLS